jgi:hypothetical protein
MEAAAGEKSRKKTQEWKKEPLTSINHSTELPPVQLEDSVMCFR